MFFQDYYRNLVNCARINDVIQLEKIIGYIDDINEIEENGWTPLMIACFNGSADVVKVLIEHGADVNGTNLNGTSPIMYAKEYTLSKGDFSCLKLLLENGATLNTLDIYNRTVFIIWIK
ncbi:MAG: ankyrin repeat domain-containing protein [Bacteroidales bacterium]